jgi:hypothetical protein
MALSDPAVQKSRLLEFPKESDRSAACEWLPDKLSPLCQLGFWRSANQDQNTGDSPDPRVFLFKLKSQSHRAWAAALFFR